MSQPPQAPQTQHPAPAAAPPAPPRPSPYSSPPQHDPAIARAGASAAQLKSLHERLEKLAANASTALGADDLAALNACVTELTAMCSEEKGSN